MQAFNAMHQTEGVRSRMTAIDILVRVESGGRSDRLIDRALRDGLWVDPDRRLVTELVYGCLRRQSLLDRTLVPYCQHSLSGFHRDVRAALRVGVYQCALLDTVPAHAAVSTAVDAIKKSRPGAAGLVNGVLRSWLRAGGVLERGDPHSLSDRFDVPAWWAGRLEARSELDGLKPWLAATLKPAPLALRVLGDTATIRTSLERQGVQLVASHHVEGAFLVTGGSVLSTDELRLGAIQLRSEAAQLVTALLPPTTGGTVLDLCSGRGGKTVQLACRPDVARVVAIDREFTKLRDCRSVVAAADGAAIDLVTADLTLSLPVSRLFGRILVDVPCSGLGTVRRHPEIKWRVTPEGLAKLGVLQVRILTSAASVLAPGGTLLYITCSTEPEENEAVIETVLAADNRLRLATLRTPHRRDSDLVGPDGYLRTWAREELDGFFAALLLRVL